MSDKTIAALVAAQGLDDLYPIIAENRYTAGWHKARPSLWREPKTPYRPLHWRYKDAYLALDRAGEWVSTELAERRNLLMFNPVGDNDYATVPSIVTAYQMIKPHEYARTHRHTPNALRLILDAKPGVYTVVNGVKLPMRAGDVLLTPNLHWHSHYNEGEHNAYWIDFLDVPLVHLLQPMFFDELPGTLQDVQSEPDPETCPFVFSRVSVLAKLAEIPDGPGGARRYVLPSEAFIPTMTLSYLHIHAGGLTPQAKTTANRIFAVTEGRGEAKVGDRNFAFERGDVFCVPSWTSYEIGALETALLFEVSDEAALRKLNLYFDRTPGSAAR